MYTQTSLCTVNSEDLFQPLKWGPFSAIFGTNLTLYFKAIIALFTGAGPAPKGQIVSHGGREFTWTCPTVEFHGIPWNFTEFPEIPWTSVEFYVIPWKPHAFLRELHGIL